MELSLRYIGKIVAFFILSSILKVCTKENDKFGSLSKAHLSDLHEWSKHSTADSRHTSKGDSKYCNPNQESTNCTDTGGDCIQCQFDDIIDTCRYGENVNVTCRVHDNVSCTGDRTFKKEIICQYCYQTPLWQQICTGLSTCNSLKAPRHYFRANCTVTQDVICLGHRQFNRMMPCNWKNGYRWSTALILSITLGGFGADRFYLGRWQEGIGKLFSFGGLGLWTIIDIILIGLRYLGPSDGSLYVD